MKLRPQKNTALESLNKRHILDVYLSKIPPAVLAGDVSCESGAAVFATNTSSATGTSSPTSGPFSKERAEEILSITNPLLKAQKTYSWILLTEAVKNSFNRDLMSLNPRKNIFGKWKCKDIFFSISHCENYVAAAVSSLPVGIDLESVSGFNKKFIDEKKQNLLKKNILCKKEARTFTEKNKTTESLLLCWQKKESAFKCFGKTNFIPSRINTLSYNYKTLNPNLNKDLQIVLTSKNLSAVRYFVFENNKSVQTMEYFNP